MNDQLEQAARATAAEPTAIDAAEAALRAGDFKHALDTVRRRGGPRVRALRVESEALLELGEVTAAEARANDLIATLKANGDADPIDEADALLHLGRARYKAAGFADAAAIFSQALESCDASERPTAGLRADILGWRSRCYRRMRLWSAAQTDLDVAMPLAAELGDQRLIANISFQASLLAERTGQTLMAAGLAEQAREIYEKLGDRRSLARILNNLGGLNWLLGRVDVAFELLRDAFAIATEVESTTDAAQAISSLAQVLLGDGQPDQSEAAARHAIELLAGREDYHEEIGNATLVLARALFEQERHAEAETAVVQAEERFTSASATSAVAAALVVRGDIRRTLGDVDEAADLYRRAADLLHDYRF
jgi:tetratricopeptide (TPR) repeat protein